MEAPRRARPGSSAIPAMREKTCEEVGVNAILVAIMWPQTPMRPRRRFPVRRADTFGCLHAGAFLISLAPVFMRRQAQ